MRSDKGLITRNNLRELVLKKKTKQRNMEMLHVCMKFKPF